MPKNGWGLPLTISRGHKRQNKGFLTPTVPKLRIQKRSSAARKTLAKLSIFWQTDRRYFRVRRGGNLQAGKKRDFIFRPDHNTRHSIYGKVEITFGISKEISFLFVKEKRMLLQNDKGGTKEM